MRYSIALLDQALVSACNVIIALLLGRVLPPAEFGAFALCMSVALIALAVQSAAWLQPLAMLVPRAAVEQRPGVAGSVLIANARAVAAGVVVATVSIGGLAASGHRAGAGATMWTLLLAAPWLAQEAVRRLHFAHDRPRDVALVDLVAYGGALGLLSVLAAAGKLSVGSAIGALAAMFLAGALVGARRGRALAARPDGRSAPTDRWQHAARWLVPATAAQTLAGQAIVLVPAAVGGVADAGAVRAALTIVGVVNVVTLSMHSSLLPRASEIAGGIPARLLARRVFRMALPGLSLAATLLAMAALAARQVLELAYGDNYADQATTLRLLALYTALMLPAHVASIVLRAARMERGLFHAQLVNAAVAVPLVVGGAITGGAAGAAAGGACGALLGSCVMLGLIARGDSPRPAGSALPLEGRNDSVRAPSQAGVPSTPRHPEPGP